MIYNMRVDGFNIEELYIPGRPTEFELARTKDELAKKYSIPRHYIRLVAKTRSKYRDTPAGREYFD